MDLVVGLAAQADVIDAMRSAFGEGLDVVVFDVGGGDAAGAIVGDEIGVGGGGQVVGHWALLSPGYQWWRGATGPRLRFDPHPRGDHGAGT